MMLYVITFIFIVLDFISGILKALKKKEYTSSIMREGLFHKAGSMLLVVLGVLGDYAQTMIDLGVNIPLANAFCGYIILMEIGSIIENIGEINPNILSTNITKYFSKLNDKEK